MISIFEKRLAALRDIAVFPLAVGPEIMRSGKVILVFLICLCLALKQCPFQSSCLCQAQWRPFQGSETIRLSIFQRPRSLRLDRFQNILKGTPYTAISELPGERPLGHNLPPQESRFQSLSLQVSKSWWKLVLFRPQALADKKRSG